MAIVCALLCAPAQATRPNTTCPKFISKVWSKERWQRGQPKPSTIRAFRATRCSRSAWRKIQSRYYEHRRAMLWRARVTPFYYAGHWWAAPYPIALCESGGDYYVGFAGAYGLIAPGWSTGGGYEFAPTAGEATPREQDIVAHRLYARYGTAPWAPFEGGCAYR